MSPAAGFDGADNVFEAGFEQAVEAQILHRVATDGALSVMSANRRAVAVLGLSADPASSVAVPSDVLDTMRDGILESAASGRVQTREMEVTSSDGRRLSCIAMHVPLRGADGTVTHVSSSFRDIGPGRAAESSALEANRLLRMAEGIAHVGHWRLDQDGGSLFWSEEVYRIHGRDPSTFDLTLQTALGAYHPDDRAVVADKIRAAQDIKGFIDLTARIVRPDGDVRTVLVRGFCQKQTSSERLMFGVIMDISDLRRAETRLRENAALLKATLDNMDQGLLMADPGGRVPICNRRALELLRLPAALMASHPQASEVRAYQERHGECVVFAPSDGASRRATSGGVDLDIRERTRPDGATLEIRTVELANGALVQTFTDVTARRRAEAAERTAEARYRLLADNTSDLIVLGRADGRRTYVSPAVQAMLGYTVKEAVRLRLRSLIHPDDLEGVFAAASGLSSETPEATVIYRMRRKDARYIWAEAALRRVQSPDGGEATIVIAVRDVTERQERIEQLRLAHDIAEVARANAENASRAKTDFLATMSHEIRTPLNAVIGFTELMVDSGKLGADQQLHAELVRSSGRALLTLVNDILDFSQVEAGAIELAEAPFSLPELVENSVAIVRGIAAAKGLRIETRIDPSARGDWAGDEARLRQIVLNLLNNAVKFTERGSVTVEVAFDTSAGRLRMRVIDTEIGIPVDKRHRLFQRFSQVDGSVRRNFGGTGLGLAICKRLIELMGGEIGVASEMGRGSEFWFTVSLRRCEADARKAAPAVRAGEARAKGRLLLAEDVPVNQDLARLVLEAAGHSVDVVSDGAAAVEAVRTEAVYDLILMDVQMPSVDGVTATRLIRDLAGPRGRTPIIAMTANVLPEQIRQFHDAGMDDHVGKPFNRRDLVAAVERWVSRGAVAPAPAAFDPNIHDELVSLLGRDVVCELLGKFRRELVERLADLTVATPGDRARLRQAAHIIVPAAGMLGFTELAKACSDLHACGEEQIGRDDIRVFCARLDRLLEQRGAVLVTALRVAETPSGQIGTTRTGMGRVADGGFDRSDAAAA